MLKRIPETQWHYAQPPEPFPRVPGSGCILGPTGSGKTQLTVQMLLQPYRNVFSRIYVFSPSVHIDNAWDPVREHNRKVLGVDDTKEQTMWDHWSEEALEQIMARQAKMIKHMKDERKKYGGKLLAVCVLLDDLADNPALHKAHGVLASIMTRGRHQGVSAWILSQKMSAMSLISRINFRWMIVFRLRNLKELLDGILYELSAVHDVATLRQMYDQAVSKPFGFWFINLMKQPEEMFYSGFEEQFVL